MEEEEWSPPGHDEWGVCLLLEQVVCLIITRQTAVCDESCRVGRPGWGESEQEVREARDGELCGPIENQILTCSGYYKK